MNDVRIGNNELRPPTVFNMSVPGVFNITTRTNVSAPNRKIQRHSFATKDNTIIGITTLDLSGYSQIDNAETILGDTVADAFLMNSWDDTEIR